LLLTGLTFWEAAILSVILARRMPAWGWQWSMTNGCRCASARPSTSSRLNDGIAVPLLMFFIALAEAEQTYDLNYWLRFAAEQIGFECWWECWSDCWAPG
jgi:hypothetical protein